MGRGKRRLWDACQVCPINKASVRQGFTPSWAVSDSCLAQPSCLSEVWLQLLGRKIQPRQSIEQTTCLWGGRVNESVCGLCPLWCWHAKLLCSLQICTQNNKNNYIIHKLNMENRGTDLSTRSSCNQPYFKQKHNNTNQIFFFKAPTFQL